MKAFVIGFVQVALIACNTYQIAHAHIAGAIVGSFAISYVWTLGVSTVSRGSHTEKVLYAVGSACGSGFGILLARSIYV